MDGDTRVSESGAAGSAIPDLAEWRAAVELLCRHINGVLYWRRRAFLAILIGWGIYFVAMGIAERGTSWLRSPIVIATGALILFSIISAIYRQAQSARLSPQERSQRQLEAELPIQQRASELWAADLAGRLSRGEIDGNEMLPSMRWYNRWALRPLRHPTRDKLLRRVGNHLDWYINPLSRYESLTDVLPWAALIFLAGCVGVAVVDQSWTPLLVGLGIAVFFNAMAFPLYSDDGRALAEYLQREWPPAEEQKPVPAAEPVAGLAAGMRLQRLRVLQYVQLERELRTAAQGACIFILFPSIMLLANVPFSAIRGAYYTLSAAAFVLISIMFIAYKRLSIERAVVRQLLGQSGLIRRLDAGDPSLDEIKQYAPRAFRWTVDLFKPSDPKCTTLRRQGWLVAFNLDWYLKPPARLLRLHWITTCASLALALLLFGGYYAVYNYYGYISYSMPRWMYVDDWVWLVAGIPLGLLLLGPLAYHTAQVGMWSDEFCKHLRQQMIGSTPRWPGSDTES